MQFSIKDFLSKCNQIRWELRIWSHLLKKSLMENFILCAVNIQLNLSSLYKACIYLALVKTLFQNNCFFSIIAGSF